MDATFAGTKPRAVRTAAGRPELPHRMRALYITTPSRTGGWLAEALAADSATKILLEEAVGDAAGLARLRDEAFDVVLVSHEPGELDALGLIEGYRAGGADEPILVLGTQSEPEMAALCHEIGADGYLCVHTATTRNLIWVAARAIQRHQLLRENQRMVQAEQSRLQREHEEATRLLQQQRAMLQEFEPARSAAPGADRDAAQNPLPPIRLPQELIDHYRQLLRAYVIMGSGNLAGELHQLGQLLVAAGVTARQALHLHLHVLEELVHGLGTRSSRHVMSRADLLFMEVTIHMAEGYRRRYQQRIHPPEQRLLPGFKGEN